MLFFKLTRWLSHFIDSFRKLREAEHFYIVAFCFSSSRMTPSLALSHFVDSFREPPREADRYSELEGVHRSKFDRIEMKMRVVDSCVVVGGQEENKVLFVYD